MIWDVNGKRGWNICCFVILFVQVMSENSPCDPLVPQYCSLPFPNSFFTKKDSSTQTGIRINMSPHTIPKDIFGKELIPEHWNAFDGFSPFPSILTYFPDVDPSNLPPHWDVMRSISADTSTILYDSSSGVLVPHFAELDISVEIIDSRTIMIWPAHRLNDSNHYIVAIRYLKHTNGTYILPSIGFKALRDKIVTNNSNIEYRRVEFEKYFQILESAGIKRSELQLMWDFTTASKECITKRLLFMRDDSLRRVGPNGPSYEISEIKDNFSKFIYRRVIGVMNIPLYLNSPLPGSHLVTDKEGIPIYQTNTDVTFTVLIPRSIVNGTILSPLVVQYGHGLFASQSEVETDYLQEQANRYGYVMMSCDLWGMTELDVPAIVYMISENISEIRIIPDRLSQGIINELLLMRLMKGALSNDPVLIFRGKKIIDIDKCYYYGVSLGGVLGEVYMAVTTDIQRGVLGVAGGPFGLLLPRSQDFKQFEDITRILYPEPVEFMMMLSLINMLWSRCEPNGYMSFIRDSLLPDTPNHQVLYQYGLGDAQVNILGLYSIARSINAKMFISNVKQKYYVTSDKVITEKLYGFQFVNDNVTLHNESVAVGYDCQALPEPVGNTPPNASTDTHNLPRRAKKAQQQIDIFLREANIYNSCNGPCTDCSSW